MSNTGTYIYDKERKELVKISDKTRGIPDVYFRKPDFVEHLADEKNIHGQMIYSKRHKKEVMDRLGVSESGDKIHGSRF